MELLEERKLSFLLKYLKYFYILFLLKYFISKFLYLCTYYVIRIIIIKYLSYKNCITFPHIVQRSVNTSRFDCNLYTFEIRHVLAKLWKIKIKFVVPILWIAHDVCP